jgi:hypothetical protein
MQSLFQVRASLENFLLSQSAMLEPFHITCATSFRALLATAGREPAIDAGCVVCQLVGIGIVQGYLCVIKGEVTARDAIWSKAPCDYVWSKKNLKKYKKI